MAIIEDPQRIGVQPSNRYIREFKTDLPSPDLSGVQRISAALSNVAEENLKEDADLKAKEFAYSQTLQKDEGGNYLKPVLPEGFGPYARKKSNELLDERMIQTTYYDIQPELDKIRNHPDNMRDPERTSVLMNSYIDSRIKGLPPAIGERLRPLAMREVQERVSHVAARSAEEARASSITDLKKTLDLHYKNIFELTALGTEEALAKAQGFIEASTRIQGILVGQKAESPQGIKLVEEALQSLQEGGKIFGILKAQFEQGSLNSKHLTDISRILNGGGVAGENVFGITPENAISVMPNPDVRKALVSKIDDFHSKVIDREQKSADEQMFSAFKAQVDGGSRIVKPMDMSDTAYAKHILRLSQDYGINPNTPEGLQQLSAKIGGLPTEYYKHLFETARNEGQLEALLPLYNRIQSFPDRQGMPQNMAGELLKEKDNSLMYNYTLFREENKMAHADALAAARTAVANGYTIEVDKTKLNAKVLSALRADGESYATPQDLEKYIQKKMDAINPSWYEGGSSIFLKDMPNDVREKFLGVINRQIAADVPLEAAVFFGVGHLKANYTASPLDIRTALATRDAEFFDGKVGAPIISNSEVVPSIINPLDPRKNSTDYIKGPMAELLAQGKGLKVLNGFGSSTPLPDGAELGKNVFLKSTGSSDKTFMLVYFDPKVKGSEQTFVSYADGKPVTVNFNKIAREQEIYITAKIKESLSTGKPWIPKIEGAPITDPLTGVTSSEIISDTRNIYKPVDVKDILPYGGIPNSTGGGTPAVGTKPAKVPKVTGLTSPSNMDYPKADPNVDVKNMRPELREFVKEIQGEFGGVVLTSGARDVFRNKAVGGAKYSQHLDGNAFDLRLVGMDEFQKEKFIKHVLDNPDVGGIGIYDNGTLHIDYRDPKNKAAWGQNRSNTSLPNTPWWFQTHVKPWLNKKVATNG